MRRLTRMVFIILVIWFGVTWFTSSQIEQAFDDVIAKQNQQITQELPSIKIEKKSFNKGLISSTAKTFVIIEPEVFDTDQSFKLTFNHTIFHGPVMLTEFGVKIGTSYIISTLDRDALSPHVKDIVMLLFADEAPFVSGIRTGFNDVISLDLDIAPIYFDSETFDVQFDQTSEDKMLLTLDGISIRFTTDTDISMLKGSLDIGKITLEGAEDEDDFSMVMSASRTDFDIDQLYQSVALVGSVEFNSSNILLSDGDTSLSLKGLKLQSLAGEENDHYSGAWTINIDKMAINDLEQVDVPEAAVKIKFSVKGLEQQAVKNIITIGNELQQAQYMMGDDPDLAMDELTRMLETYYVVLVQSITQGVAINNVIKVTTDHGSVATNFDMSYIDVKKLIDLQTVRELVLALQGQLNVTIDKSLIVSTELEDEIAMQLEMGFAVENNNSYESLIVLDAGVLNMNGMPMPLLNMLGSESEHTLPWAGIQ